MCLSQLPPQQGMSILSSAATPENWASGGNSMMSNVGMQVANGMLAQTGSSGASAANQTVGVIGPSPSYQPRKVAG